MNATMSKYIFGLAVDVAFIFVTVLIGYLVIGIPYAFLFALFSAVTTLIPYLGPYIGVTPVVLAVAWAHPWTALIAVVYVLIIQQLDGNLIYPKIVGTAVHVHPVTVMILMLVMGDLFGLLGMVVAVPGYALVKEIVKFIAGIYQNAKAHRQEKIEP
jgi:predicted PurR-regulated permease PerM